MVRKMQKGFIGPFPLQIEWLQNHVGIIEAEIWTFGVAHQGYLTLGGDRPLLKPGSLRRPGNRNFQHCMTSSLNPESLDLPPLTGPCCGQLWV